MSNPEENPPTEVEPVVVAPEPAVVEPAAEPTAEAEPEAPAAAAATPEPPAQQPKWALERIDRLTRDKGDLARALAEKDALIAKLQPQPEATPNAPTTPQTFTVEDLQREAARIANESSFNDKCNDVATKGKTEYQDFDTVMANHRVLGGLTQSMVEAALELGNAHSVLYNLGKNMDEAARIRNLPPAQQGVALARFAGTLAAPKAPSKTPAPIAPVGGSARSNDRLDDTTISMEEWARRRKAQRAKAS